MAEKTDLKVETWRDAILRRISNGPYSGTMLQLLTSYRRETKGPHPCCSECAFYAKPEEGGTYGECRRQAPNPDGQRWSLVEPTDWCGEFEVVW